MDYLQVLLLFLVGLFAGFINVLAGGGGVIVLPILIFMGLDGIVANGTNRIAILIQNIIAVIGFRHQKLHQFDLSIRLAAFTLPGAILGAWVAVNMDDAWFQKILAYVMIGIVVSIAFPQSPQNKSSQPSQWKRGGGYVMMFAFGFYGGFIQLGSGFFLMAILFHLFQLTWVHVNMHKVFIISFYTFPALAIFIYSGNINWKFGIPLAMGNAIGAWFGSYAAVKGGEKVIRIVLIVAILAMSFKLLDFF